MAVKFRKGIDLQNQKAINAADPTAATDVVNKQYVDNLVAGLSYKNEVKAASTTNGTLATAYVNGATLDGVTLATGDRILLKDQTTGLENGIRIVAASGAPPRASDADSTAELNNATVYVTNGTVNGGREYTQTAKDPVVDTTALVFAQKTSGVTYTADGNGIELSGSQFALELEGTTLTKSAAGLRIGSGAAGAGLTESTGVLAVGQGAGISVTADAVAVDTTVVARIYSATSAATTNPQTFPHGLGKKPSAEVIIDATGERVMPDITVDATNVVVDWGSAPTAGEYRVIAVG
jgi:hypothetical protein